MAGADDHLIMNSIIHAGLRRDLARLEVVTSHPMGDVQRRAVCDFVPWMTMYLHHHHVGEDEGMWPRVLAKRPDLAPLAGINGAEHQQIVEASGRLEGAAAALAASGSEDDRQALADAVQAMATATIPHLDHEEAESAPVVGSVLDEDDWAYLEKNYYRKGMPFRDVGMALMWMVDDLDPHRAECVHQQIPGPIGWVMSAMFGGRYDKAASQRWGRLAGTRR